MRKLSYFMIWLFLVLMAISLIINHESNLRIKGSKFDRAFWLAEQHRVHPAPGVYEGTYFDRGLMYNDLNKNHLKFLMKKEDIESLLGHSTEKRKYRGWYRFSDCFQYDIDYCGSGFGGSRHLVVFCNNLGTNLYGHGIIENSDFSHDVYEDQEEIDKRRQERTEQILKERQRLKEQNNGQN